MACCLRADSCATRAAPGASAGVGTAPAGEAPLAMSGRFSLPSATSTGELLEEPRSPTRHVEAARGVAPSAAARAAAWRPSGDLLLGGLQRGGALV